MRPRLTIGRLLPPPDVNRWAAWTAADRGGGPGPMVGTVVLAAPETFCLIGHSLITLLITVAGGLYARRRHDRLRSAGDAGDLAASPAGMAKAPA